MTQPLKQGTPEWHQARLGKVTASRVADVTAKTRSGYSASRANYMAQLLCERLTGTREESYTNAAMQWGADMEPKARIAYQFMTDTEVVEEGFIDHPTIAMSGCSPDGLVGDDGMVEIKCPNTATHIETLLGEPIDGKYIKQMQWQMACAGRQWCDFVSYDPRLTPELQIKIIRVPLDIRMVAELQEEVQAFLNEVVVKLVQLEALAK